MRQYYSQLNHIINYISIIPYLYRYENKIYIDKFFDTGELFISSFHNYQKHPDNELGDKNEGTSFNTAKIDNNSMAMCMQVNTGMNDFTFCTSTIYDENLLTKFSRDSVFRIIDPLNFIIEVTKSLTRVFQVLHGHCIYIDRRSLSRNFPTLKLSDIKNTDGDIPIENIMSISNQVQGFDSYFIKEKKYQHQSEYRILWQTDRFIKDGILIYCPEAVKFCEKI